MAKNLRPLCHLRIKHAISTSPAQLLQDRKATLAALNLSIPDSLPVAARADELIRLIQHHRVLVVAGETGSGKSTQLPKLCLKAGLGVQGMIGHTQPRRLAARSVAARIAEETGSELGQAVGAKVRFDDQTSDTTLVKLLTDGMLLSELSRDPNLRAYQCIIVDEAHERSLNIDLLLGHLKRLLDKRRDLKIIITSATIDTARFADFFDGAPVVTVEGRTFPVEVRWRPADTQDDTDNLLDATAEALSTVSGDLLVFQPTERDVHACVQALENRFATRRGAAQSNRLEVVPLYGRLTNSQQQKVFKRGKARRIVVATNVAESSVTVPNIHAVVDTGTARISRFAARSGVQRLPVEPVSQASCEQRKGRCGRVAPGVCFRLYSEDDFKSRDAFTAPEVQRASLSGAVLQCAAMGLGDLARFPFIEPPQGRAVREAQKTLHEIGALDALHQLTPVGTKLARLPVDPRAGRMILQAADEGVLPDTLIIAAALEAQDPRERPLEKRTQADQAHARFHHATSDFLTLLNIWNAYHDQKRSGSHSQLRKWCQKHFVSDRRMREWVDLQKQLAQITRQLKLKGKNHEDTKGTKKNTKTSQHTSASSAPLRETFPNEEAKEDAIHRSLLAGLLSGLARRIPKDKKKDKGRPQPTLYQTAGGGELRLWPGSVLSKDKPEWVFAAERLETSDRFLLTLARADPQWAEELGAHLVTRSLSEPQWIAETGSAMATEHLRLLSLPVRQKHVRLAGHDAPQARAMFIQHALLEGDCPPLQETAFWKHNQLQLAQLKRDEAKLGENLQKDWQQLTELWEARLPENICDLADLRSQRKKNRGRWPKWLFLDAADLRQPDAAQPDTDLFPDRLRVGENTLPLDYQLEDGTRGLHLRLPAAQLAHLDARRLGWLVPGLLCAKCEALIKCLPKDSRRMLNPAGTWAQKATAQMTFGQGDVLSALARALSKLSGFDIKPNDFDLSKLDSAQHVHLTLLNEEGQSVATGTDLADLRKQASPAAMPQSLIGLVPCDTWSAPGTTDPACASPFLEGAPLPEAFTESTLTGFVALADLGAGVAPRLFAGKAIARHHHTRALRALAHQTLAPACKACCQGKDWEAVLIGDAVLPKPLGKRALQTALGQLAVERACLQGSAKELWQIRDADTFQARIHTGKQLLEEAMRRVLKLAASICTQHQHVMKQLDSASWPDSDPMMQDIRSQLAHLLETGAPGGFWLSPRQTHLQSFPRYLAAIASRIDKARAHGIDTDRKRHAQVSPLWIDYLRRTQKHRHEGTFDPERDNMRWLLEEYRVHLFAQELGTGQKVSAERLRKQWTKVLP